MTRVLFRLWVVATIIWAAYCWLMLPHGAGMGSAYAFAILVPSGTIFVLGGGVAWALTPRRHRAIRVTEVRTPGIVR